MQKPYDLINWFWRKQRAYSINSDGISLFFFLFQHCNDAEWEINPFELRIENVRSALGITEERVHSARQALEKAGVLQSLAQFGRGKGYIFFLTCLPVQSEELYRLLTTEPEKGDEKGAEKPSQKGMKKEGTKGDVKEGGKDQLKEELKGAEKDPFYPDFSPPLLDGVLTPLLDHLSTPETASNGENSTEHYEEVLPSNSPPKIGGEEEEEDDEDTNYLPLTRTREEVEKVSARTETKRQPSKPIALQDVLAYAEQQRTMQGKVMATPLLAEKFWEYYQETGWYITPKGGKEPQPIADWRKKFNEWEMTEREEASKRPPPYSLNVNDIPHELRSVSNFNDVWSDYLTQCASLGAAHDKMSARYAMEHLVFRQKQGEKVLEILNTAIRNQRRDFWSTNGTINRGNPQNGSPASGRGRTQRKPKLSPGSSGAPTEEAVTFS